MKNEVVMDQLILFHKPNKKVRSEKKMDHFIPQTKHTIKDEFVVTRGQVTPLEEEVRLLREKVAPLEEEVHLLKENLRMVANERDKSSRQATEASLCVDSLTRDQEAERPEGQGLRVQMGGKRLYFRFLLAVSQCLFLLQSSIRIWTPPSRPL
jgi:predicted RNase H-like nuclease (RuvC/YqgF family)